MTSLPLAVTTAVKPAPSVEAQAQALAQELAVPYLPRLGRPLSHIFSASDAARLLIAGGDHLRLLDRATKTKYYFHPNMFVTRGSNVLRGQPDHFLEATGPAPWRESFRLHPRLRVRGRFGVTGCVVESGIVHGLESVPELAAVTCIGVQSFPLPNAALEAALRRVQVIQEDYRFYLEACADDMYDVVYFDPFFEKRLPGSETSVHPLFVFGNPTPLDLDAVQDAIYVACRRVVIKHSRYEPLPEGISELVTATVGSQKSRLVYSVIETRLFRNL